MKDLQIYTAIVAGDPVGLAAAYDRYAARLYAYCRSMLPEPADATDAVHDTYLIAAVELRRLRNPARLRPWLYAVARKECLRRLRTGIPTTTLDEIADVTADTAATDPAAQAEQAELRALVRRAIGGLNPRDRDIIELSLVHELDGNDLIYALGVPRNHAHALLSRARGQLEKSLGALIVAQGGRQACPDLDAMLEGWNGRLTVLLRKRLNRHIDKCETCLELRRRELNPTLLTGLAPLPVVLPALLDQLLRLVGDHSPAGLAHRVAVARHAAPFGPSGFPRPVSPPGPLWHIVPRHPRSVVAGAAGVVIVAGLIVIGGSSGGPAGGTHDSAGLAAGAIAVLPGRHTGPDAIHPVPSGAAGAEPGSGTKDPAGGGAGSTGGPDPTLTPGAPDPAGSAQPLPTGTTPAPGQNTGTPRQGTLIVVPGLDPVTLNGTPIGSIRLTAQGGPVSHWTVTPSIALAGKVSVSPSSGSLAAGASVTVTVTSETLLSVGVQLTINPGNQTITVLLGL